MKFFVAASIIALAAAAPVDNSLVARDPQLGGILALPGQILGGIIALPGNLVGGLVGGTVSGAVGGLGNGLSAGLANIL